MHEIRDDALQNGNTYDVRYRYRQTLRKGVFQKKEGGDYFLFDEPVSHAAPGQSLVFYDGGECLGSGIITV